MQTVSRKQDDNDHLTQAFGPGRRRPKGLHAEIDFRGNPIWTYREGHGQRIRINEAFGTQAFEEAYYKARLTYGHADAPVEAPKPFGLSPTNPASLAWLIDQFLRSPGQRQMAEGTQKQRRNVLGRIAKKNGSTPFRAITDDTIRELRDTIAATGKLTAANSAIAQLRLAFDWAVDQKHVTKNPCLGVKGVKYKGGTNHVWTDVEASRFEQAYPLGTRERLAYALLLYSGQRGVDVVKMGRQHIHDGLLTGINAAKDRKPIDVPVLPVLQEAIDACQEKGDLTFLLDPKTGARSPSSGSAGGSAPPATRLACRTARRTASGTWAPPAWRRTAASTRRCRRSMGGICRRRSATPRPPNTPPPRRPRSTSWPSARRE